MAGKSPLSELREMNVRRQRETQSAAEESVPLVPVPTLSDDIPEDSIVAIQEPSNLAIKQGSYLSSNLATKHPSELLGHRVSQPVSIPVASPVAPPALIPTMQVGDLRKTPLEQLNIRIPAGFNEWLAEEAHQRRREGVTKQSLVTDALEAMIKLKRENADAGS